MATKLIGSYQHSIDSKSRVIIPAKFREALGETFYLTYGTNGCLFVLPESQWIAIEDKINALPITEAAEFQRSFYALASEGVPDKQGRVLVPQNLREYAGLTKDVTIAGAGNRVELWDTDRWNERQNSAASKDIWEIMSALGL